MDARGCYPQSRAFAEAAEDAKDNCPVSGALKGNVELKVNARIAG